MEEAALARVEAKEKEAMTRMRALAIAAHLVPKDQIKRAARRQQAREMLDRWACTRSELVCTFMCI
eukprot:885037-Pelagomonas_calceolata.AAC.1